MFSYNELRLKKQLILRILKKNTRPIESGIKNKNIESQKQWFWKDA